MASTEDLIACYLAIPKRLCHGYQGLSGLLYPCLAQTMLKEKKESTMTLQLPDVERFLAELVTTDGNLMVEAQRTPQQAEAVAKFLYW